MNPDVIRAAVIGDDACPMCGRPKVITTIDTGLIECFSICGTPLLLLGHRIPTNDYDEFCLAGHLIGVMYEFRRHPENGVPRVYAGMMVGR